MLKPQKYLFMKIIIITTALILISVFNSDAQKIVKKINASVTEKSVESKLGFLASDELRGRDTGSPELDIAARYIAEKYREYGLQIAPNLSNYFQPVQLYRESNAKTAQFVYNDKIAVYKKDIVFLSGDNKSYQGEVAFVNYGLEEDYNGVDVKGKIVMALPGTKEVNSPREYRDLSFEKQKIAQKKGAIGSGQKRVKC